MIIQQLLELTDVSLNHYSAPAGANIPLAGSPGVARITIGDMHANPIKFLQFLIWHQFIEMSKKDYLNFVERYEELGSLSSDIRSPSAPTRISRDDEDYNPLFFEGRNSSREMDPTEKYVEKISSFCEQLRAKIKFRKEASQTTLFLIGDLLGDRGNNDLLILEIIRLLHKQNCDFTIALSNHDLFFLAWYSNQYEKEKNSDELVLLQDAYSSTYFSKELKAAIELENQGLSLQNLILYLSYLSKKNNTAFRDVMKNIQEIVNNAYLDKLVLFDTTLSLESEKEKSEKGKIEIYSHAPTRLSQLKEVAGLMGVDEDFFSTESLASAIDKINQSFKMLVKKEKSFFEKMFVLGWGTNLSLAQNIPTRNYTDELMFLIYSLTWTRRNNENFADDGLLKKAREKINITFIHGHDGVNKSHKEMLDIYVNLDSLYGKIDRNYFLQTPSKEAFKYISYSSSLLKRTSPTKQPADNLLEMVFQLIPKEDIEELFSKKVTEFKHPPFSSLQILFNSAKEIQKKIPEHLMLEVVSKTGTPESFSVMVLFFKVFPAFGERNLFYQNLNATIEQAETSQSIPKNLCDIAFFVHMLSSFKINSAEKEKLLFLKNKLASCFDIIRQNQLEKQMKSPQENSRNFVKNIEMLYYSRENFYEIITNKNLIFDKKTKIDGNKLIEKLDEFEKNPQENDEGLKKEIVKTIYQSNKNVEESEDLFYFLIFSIVTLDQTETSFNTHEGLIKKMISCQIALMNSVLKSLPINIVVKDLQFTDKKYPFEFSAVLEYNQQRDPEALKKAYEENKEKFSGIRYAFQEPSEGKASIKMVFNSEVSSRQFSEFAQIVLSADHSKAPSPPMQRL